MKLLIFILSGIPSSSSSFSTSLSLSSSIYALVSTNQFDLQHYFWTIPVFLNSRSFWKFLIWDHLLLQKHQIYVSIKGDNKAKLVEMIYCCTGGINLVAVCSSTGDSRFDAKDKLALVCNCKLLLLLLLLWSEWSEIL